MPNTMVVEDLVLEHSPSEQSELLKQPKINGLPLVMLPDDLYIPPDAMTVFLEAFEGPLDLLLYLIRKQNINILDIPVWPITRQYLKYIEVMQSLRLELAAEYLLMAALLAEIKSRLLLPKHVAHHEVTEDPRMELVRRLQEYERFKTAAENLECLPRVDRDYFIAAAKPELLVNLRPLPRPQLAELLFSLREVLLRAELFSRHQIAREPLSLRSRMSSVLHKLRTEPALLSDLYDFAEGKAGVVVCILAILELSKLSLIEIVQDAPFAPVYLAIKSREVVPENE